MRQAVLPESLRDAVAATGFSPAIRAGEFLFLTGATGGLPDGTMPATGGAQAEVALGKALTVLNAAELGPEAVVELTSYHTAIAEDFDDIQSVVTRLLGTPLPAWTAVEVAGLRRPGARVEFRIVAHVQGAENP
ncbi:Rid family hydrolase [Nioella aestuarii]|uniref:Rid family hydrolase n=1 Tax=Nioella aestuarii TaxID=1662864 RepID=UPI003D7F4E37